MSPTQPAQGKPKLVDEFSFKSHPALQPTVTDVPVTPGVHLSGHSAYTNPTNGHQDNTQPFNPDKATAGPSWSADSYFTPKQKTQAPSPTEAAAGAKYGEELLRRFSAVQDPSASYKQNLVDIDPRAAHPELNLSGRIISATFTVPYNIAYAPGEDFDLLPRRGTSALYDLFSYLASSSSPWNHTLVGWTGEIRKKPTEKVDATFQPSGNKATVPVQVDGVPPTALPQEHDLRIGREDRGRLEKQLERDHGGKIVPVWLPDEWDEKSDEVILKDQGRWRTYAEHELYTLCHYKQNEPTDGRAARKSWADYCCMNKLYADRILELHKPGDMIIVHDFYLFLLPSLLRQRLRNIYVGFFLHVPFPSSELYRCLSRRKEILKGVLRANMIGFQAYSYSQHFLSCCTRILGFDSSSTGVDAYGAHVAVEVCTIGINVASKQKRALLDPVIEEKIKTIKDMYRDKKIIVGRDRLDAAHGVLQKLQAFELFLERYPKWREKVVLVQITSPSNISADKEGNDDEKMMEKLSDLVARINGTYGSLSFTPVRHFPQYLEREEYFALFRLADVGLITSVRDGMNTISLEYIISQKNNCGPLILSEFSGTAGSLSGAIHINPWDFNGVAEAINNALTMPQEQRKKDFQPLYEHVVSNTVQAWCSNFLKRLVTSLSSSDQ